MPNDSVEKLLVEKICEWLRVHAKDAGNYDGHPEPHCHRCAHDEAAILDAADAFAERGPKLIEAALKTKSVDADGLKTRQPATSEKSPAPVNTPR